MDKVINLYNYENTKDDSLVGVYILALKLIYGSKREKEKYRPSHLMDMGLYKYKDYNKIRNFIKNWMEYNESNYLNNYNKNISMKKLRKFIKRNKIFQDYDLSIEYDNEKEESSLKFKIKRFSFTFNNDLVLQKMLFSLFHLYTLSVWENNSKKSKFELIIPYQYNTTAILSKQYLKSFREIFKLYPALFTEVKFVYDNKFARTLSNKATELLSLLELSCWKNCGVKSEDVVPKLKFIDSVISTWRKRTKFTPDEAALVIQKFYKTNIVLYKESLAGKFTEKRRRSSTIIDLKKLKKSHLYMGTESSKNHVKKSK